MPGDEVINSDLDDSEGELDDDGEGDDEADVDIVFCVYDKVSYKYFAIGTKLTAQVQRVKNKWKTVFKDGMIHINGRDYLFQKCNGSVLALELCPGADSVASSNGRSSRRGIIVVCTV